MSYARTTNEIAIPKSFWFFFFFYHRRSIFSVRDRRAFRRRTVASRAKYAAAAAVKRRPERDKCDALVLETADSREQTPPPPQARFASNNVVESKVAIGLPHYDDYGVHYQTIIAVCSPQSDRTAITVRSSLIHASKTSINDQRYGFQRSECFVRSRYL